MYKTLPKYFRRILLSFALVLAVAPASYAISNRSCNPKVPKTIQYRPKFADCGGKAAIILDGKYERSFSVVFKKVDHNDRLSNNCPDKNCSPFKTQKTLRKNGRRIACFGAAGDSPVFRGYDPDYGFSSSFVVRWISIKLKNSGKIKDVEIYCMPKPYPVTKLN